MADKINSIRITKNDEIIELDGSSKQIWITVEENCSATVLDRVIKDKIIEIKCEKNSKIDFLSLQNSDLKSVLKIKKSAVVKDNAEINWFDCHFGGRQCNAETHTFLNGSKSFSSSKCLFFGTESQQFNFCFRNIHDGEETKSSILVRGVLDGRANTFCKNLLNISKSANNSDGIQKSEILLLNKDSKVFVLPELKINNNVKRCSHGVSIGNMDTEKLFYLMSRGFSKKDSVKQLITGFFASILPTDSDKFAGEINKLIADKIK